MVEPPASLWDACVSKAGRGMAEGVVLANCCAWALRFLGVPRKVPVWDMVTVGSQGEKEISVAVKNKCLVVEPVDESRLCDAADPCTVATTQCAVRHAGRPSWARRLRRSDHKAMDG
jgi:hypothetical protein